MGTLNFALSELSLSEKLSLMEALWEDLSSQTAPESINWHQPILADRVQAIHDGQSSVSDWEQVKQRLRQQTT